MVSSGPSRSCHDGRRPSGDRGPACAATPPESDNSFDARTRGEIAVGVLMELCGWEATKARSRLLSAADHVDAPVETVADAILALGPEHSPR
jgi:hypothetical protein